MLLDYHPLPAVVFITTDRTDAQRGQIGDVGNKTDGKTASSLSSLRDYISV